MAISILSYRGKVSLTVISDAHLLPDPECIARNFDAEFQTMLGTLPPATAKVPVKKMVARKAPRSGKQRA